MQNAGGARVAPIHKPGLVKATGGLMKELFGQLITAQFWKDLLVFTLKTAFRVGSEMAMVAAGHALITIGNKFGKGNGPELDLIKEKFGTTMQPVAPAPTPAAAAFSRSFNPSSGSYAPPGPPQDATAWPGLAPNFGSR